ncbi:MAG: anaerobic ribonucleoside triphosphate reductase [Acholeplasmatales bacterium]|jgi:ribonucleoside-triphosphate reductase|nr:anaerobic ribonucleoside triphosphate reductase [Acholeplasmatales bacterium]
MIRKIRKRDGRYVTFNREKIEGAITKAFASTNSQVEDLDKLVDDVIAKLEENNLQSGKVPTVELVQDYVEHVLMVSGFTDVAKKYILYREERSKEREKNSRLMKTFSDITFSKATTSDLKRENANIDADTPMGAMLKYGSEGAKEFNKMFVLSGKFAKAHESGDIHIHDLDFLTLTTTCCQIDLTKLFNGGFKTGHGSVREPQDIKTYAALACIAIQSNQNDQHGGQSIPKFDYDMACGVRKTYKKRFIANLDKICGFLDIKVAAKTLVNQIILENFIQKDLSDENLKYALDREIEKVNSWPSINNHNLDYLIQKELLLDDLTFSKIMKFTRQNSLEETTKDTFQAMESLIHNLNTMHSRAGAQVPFSSINYGTDTSTEGRILIKQLLDATLSGMGENETPIFPIQIFKVKEGINYNPEDPNYDLFQLAIKTTAKRLFPNFSFLDAPFNLQYYKENDPNTEIAYMGCRTRVIANPAHPDNEIVTGRGNLSFTSINLPRIAINNKTVDKFFLDLDNKITLVIEQLLERYEIQKKIHVYNFPFLMGQHVWTKSDDLNYNDSIESVIDQGTLSVGFIGLAECLKVLTGKHHGESNEAQELGLKIIKHMRARVDEACKEYKLNFSLVATPAEGLSGRFVKKDKVIYGEIEGVTNHDFYTNSFHVPVYYPISASKKIDIEAPYHELTNGGHISYVELDGDASKNLIAIEKVVRYMHDKHIGYGSINHAVDYDPLCGYVGIINDECPKCHRHESDDSLHFDRIRRITGYLVGTLDRFNDAKRSEVRERVKHL